MSPLETAAKAAYESMISDLEASGKLPPDPERKWTWETETQALRNGWMQSMRAALLAIGCSENGNRVVVETAAAGGAGQ